MTAAHHLLRQAAAILAILGSIAPVAAVMAQSEPVNIAAWTIVRGASRFTVDGGTLRVSGGGGWIRNDTALVDFVLRFDVRNVTEQAEAALLVRAWEHSPGRAESAYRVSIREDMRNREFVRGVSTRTRTLPGHTSAPASPPGAWRQYEVRMEGDRLMISINGLPVSTVEVTGSPSGFVGLEGAKGSLEFRNMVIAALPFAGPCDDFQASEGVIRISESKEPGLRPPQLRHEVKPRYSVDSMQKRIQGNVVLDATVRPDGSVAEICVKQSLNASQDAETAAALRLWRFEPAARRDEAIPVRITVDTSFRLPYLR